MKRSRGVLSPFFALCVIFAVTACGGYKTASASPAGGGRAFAQAEYARMENAAAPMDTRQTSNDSGADTPQSAPGEQAGPERKLIKRAELRIRVEDPGAIEKPLADLTGKYNAWIASTGIYENSRNYSIRVPSDSYAPMLHELVALGRVLWRSENAEDVTLRYYDLETRLATKRELLKTYQGYLSKAANIDEIMTVERHLAELQQEIDQTGTQFRNLASLVDYSTIDVDITGPVNAVSSSRQTLGEKLKELFGSFGDAASSGVVVLMGILIYGVPILLIIILLFWILFGRIGLLKKLWRLVTVKK